MLKRFTCVTVATLLSEADGVFTLEEEQRIVLKAFLDRLHFFSLVTTGFGENLVKHCSA